MTSKLTITRERLSGIARGENCYTHDDVIELALAQLAAMDSEPVAWTDEEELRDVNVAGIGYLFGIDREANKFADPRRQIMLYRHAQQPVVPEKIPENVYQVIYQECGGFVECEANAQTIYDACRAAMLQAGNSPVIPDGSEQRIAEAVELLKSAAPAMLADDSGPNGPLVGKLKAQVVPGWIPVSERMPEVGVKVLCFPVKDEPIHATFNGQLWLQDVSWSGSEEPIDNVIPVSVTHWMPLPAAPQEVKGE